MKNLLAFFKATFIGGIFFIVPIFLVIIILGKAFVAVRTVIDPIAELLPIEEIAGIAIARLLVYAVLIGICFFAGLLATTNRAQKLKDWIEDNILSLIPGYSLIKGMSESATGLESRHLKEVVVADIEEVWQIGFVMDKIDEDLWVIFLPGAPNPMSGDVVIVKKERLRVLDIPEVNAMKIYKRLGLDTKTMLNGKVKSSIFDKK